MTAAARRVGWPATIVAGSGAVERAIAKLWQSCKSTRHQRACRKVWSAVAGGFGSAYVPAYLSVAEPSIVCALGGVRFRCAVKCCVRLFGVRGLFLWQSGSGGEIYGLCYLAVLCAGAPKILPRRRHVSMRWSISSALVDDRYCVSCGNPQSAGQFRCGVPNHPDAA